MVGMVGTRIEVSWKLGERGSARALAAFRTAYFFIFFFYFYFLTLLQLPCPDVRPNDARAKYNFYSIFALKAVYASIVRDQGACDTCTVSFRVAGLVLMQRQTRSF